MQRQIESPYQVSKRLGKMGGQGGIAMRELGFLFVTKCTVSTWLVCCIVRFCSGLGYCRNGTATYLLRSTEPAMSSSRSLNEIKSSFSSEGGRRLLILHYCVSSEEYAVKHSVDICCIECYTVEGSKPALLVYFFIYRGVDDFSRYLARFNVHTKQHDQKKALSMPSASVLHR